MKNEMDILGMDERARRSWLMANRLTLMLVGVTWLGMIGVELYHGRTHWFMIVMVPVFAAFRFMAYKLYKRREPAP